MAVSVTATLGVPGSASTWVFNVARELRTLQFGAQRVHSFFQDGVAGVWNYLIQHPTRDQALVWKLHAPDATWAAFLADNHVRLVVSIRDPRDAMLSLMERFGVAHAAALHRMTATLRMVGECARYDHLRLRYEDRFFDQTRTVAAMAQHLGVALEQGEQERIYRAYQTEQVRHFAERLDRLPASRFKAFGSLQYDDVTQIHRTHIGDQKVGKWRDRFSKAEQHALTAHFEPFLRAMGYELD